MHRLSNKPANMAYRSLKARKWMLDRLDELQADGMFPERRNKKSGAARARNPRPESDATRARNVRISAQWLLGREIPALAHGYNLSTATVRSIIRKTLDLPTLRPETRAGMPKAEANRQFIEAWLRGSSYVKVANKYNVRKSIVWHAITRTLDIKTASALGRRGFLDTHGGLQQALEYVHHLLSSNQ